MSSTSMISRRQVLVAGSILPLSSWGAFAAAKAQKPRSSFGATSTAEEVTAGLDLSGKTALLTGSGAGIGYETLRVLVLRGANVYAVDRTMEQAKRACAAVNATGAKGKATPFACEQTDYASVVACADAVQARGGAIDMLICNAGVYFLPKLELAHGVEKHLVINHLSHFILVDRLLPQVKSARQGRIVVVSSDAHRAAPAEGIEFDNLSGQRYYDPVKMYAQSKLANGLHVRELARRLANTRVTANVLHPGLVDTRTLRELLPSMGGDMDKMKNVKSTAQGAATTCYVATHPSLAKVTGEYFSDCNIETPSAHMLDDRLAKKLWETSEELTREYLSRRA